jgi:hypothetical protein
MDNYFTDCPAMMSDGRIFTDYRSSQVREEIFRDKNCLLSENQTREFRYRNGEKILDYEWNNIKSNYGCYPKKKCFHKSPVTRTTSIYNNAELLAYNNVIPAPGCDVYCDDFRATKTAGLNSGCKEVLSGFDGYPIAKCPTRCSRKV